MKRFVIKLAYFVLPILIFSIGMDHFLSKNLKTSNQFARGEYLVWNDIYDGAINSEIVIYGSSRAWVHIDPQMIETQTGKTTYNLGIDGHGFWLQYLRHLELLKHNEIPETIIMSVDAFSFGRRKELYNKEQFLPYIFNYNVYKYTSVYEGFTLTDYTLPLARYVGNKNPVRISFCQFDKSCIEEPSRIKGYRGVEKTWNSDLSKAKKKMKGFTVKFNEERVGLFNQFLNECDQLGIEVILVYTPEYIEGQKFMTNRKELITFYETKAKDYNIKFLDYSNDELCYDKKYFYNATHLNKQGSQLFTAKLIQDLKLSQ